MTYYPKSEYKLIGYRKSTRKHKMYDAILKSKLTKKIIYIPFGDNRYENFRDITGLDLYPYLIHNDPKRRKNFRSRHHGYLKKGYWSPGFFSYYKLW